MIEYIGQKDGGDDKLKGKKIVLPLSRLGLRQGADPGARRARRKQYGFELTKIAVRRPGNEQQSQWLQIRQLKPDYVILWGCGVMNPAALKTAAKIGFPRDKIIGVWWAGSEEDVIPAGDAAKGYVTRRVHRVRHQLPGDAGHPEEGLRRGQGQPRGQVARRLDLSHARRRRTAS